ncbi:MAG: PASTA domain-containing protein [Bacteroidales bacterium]|nr:PASTA domain-containing protein [Bacteroidales bacterium]
MKWIIRNILWAVVIVVVLIAGAVVFLNVVTQHNRELIVPDFTNMTVAEAEALAADAGMRVEVTDSVFAKRIRKGAVRDQNPAPGSKVKEGRRISLTINALNAKKVTMPNLIDLSMRQALAELQSRGLVLGKLIYVRDMATNNVLRQLHGNREIAPGTTVETDTVVDLVVGLNPDTEASTYVPDVLGKRYMSAVDALHKQSLNIKTLRFDDSVKTYEDSLDAVVYRQSPEASDIPVNLGNDVSLYLTVNPERIPSR